MVYLCDTLFTNEAQVIEIINSESPAGIPSSPKNNRSLGVVDELGGQANTIRAALKAGNGMFPTTGNFKFIVNIGNQTV